MATPLQRTGLRRKTQELIRKLHKPAEEGGMLQIRCIPQLGKGCRQAEDAVKRLTDDVDQLEAQNNPGEEMMNVSSPKSNEKNKLLSDDVQRQLHRILEVIKELTAERGEKTACQRHAQTEEAVDLLEQFVAADLPAQLIAELPVLQFEARKDVMNTCCALMWPGMPQCIDRQVLDYLEHHPRIFNLLIKGYNYEEAALHCGVVLRSCARHMELVKAFLNSGLVVELIHHTRNPGIDIGSDAFYSLREVLLEHKQVTAAWLEENFQEFFQPYNDLLQSEDYMVERQALPLLAAMLLDRNFKRIMIQYVSNERHLQIIMNLLIDPSRAIQAEAFHVFKIFVANPQKPPRVQQILYRNKDKLVKHIEGFKGLRPDDKKFDEDQKLIIDKLLALDPPPPSKSGGGRPKETLARSRTVSKEAI
mmetsp:Transcript_90542/g.279997  ORF Transcript_90542/g.279997 Transcript_90542/m.279997 type:complete len:419 (-) Transcript_90542:122-1378(-)